MGRRRPSLCLRPGHSGSLFARATGRLLAALLLAGSLIACGHEANESAPAGGAYLVLPRTPEKIWWRQRAVEGLERVGVESVAPTASITFDGEAGLRGALRDLGAAGAEVVFCLCPEADHVVFAEAVTAPETEFVVIGGATHGANVSGVVFRLDEAAQLAGALSVALSGEAPVGVLAGPAPRAWWQGVEAAFTRGVAEADRRRQVVRGEGPFAPEELALAGVKVVFYLADPADSGVLRACHDGELLVVASDERALEKAPEVVVATLLVDLPGAMAEIAADIFGGVGGGSVHSFPLGSGTVDLKLNDRMRATRDPEVRAALYRAREEITGGISEVERLGIGQ